MDFNLKKLKRSNFINYTLTAGSLFLFFKKIPLIIYGKEKSTNKNIIIKSNPLSVRRENSGEKNV